MLQWLRSHQSIIKMVLMLACVAYLAYYLWANRNHLGVVFAFTTLQVSL